MTKQSPRASRIKLMVKPEIITIPPAQFVVLEGVGAPDAFLDYAHLLREVVNALGQKLNPLEALWWTTDSSEMSPHNPNVWRWLVMLKLEQVITQTELKQAILMLQKTNSSPLLDKITLETYDEGQVVQMRYTGSLKDKEPEMALLKQFAQENGYELTGKYHEIYFDDPGPGSPPDAKTMLRYPVRKLT